jgi:hypothetical protein
MGRQGKVGIAKKAIRFGKGFGQFRRVTLGKTTGKEYFFMGVCAAVGNNRINRFLFGAFNKTAGINNNQIRISGIFHLFPAGAAKNRHHSFGINLIFYTT